MYNLTVSEDHTYVVGSGQWVVHNTFCREDFEEAASLTAIARNVRDTVRTRYNNKRQPNIHLAAGRDANGKVYITLASNNQTDINRFSDPVATIARNSGYEFIPAAPISGSSGHAERNIYRTLGTDIIGVSARPCYGGCDVYFGNNDVLIGFADFDGDYGGGTVFFLNGDIIYDIPNN